MIRRSSETSSIIWDFGWQGQDRRQKLTPRQGDMTESCPHTPLPISSFHDFKASTTEYDSVPARISSGTKRPRAARYRLTTADGSVESLTATEIQTIFLAPGMARWADSDADALKRADAASFGFDQHCRFEMGGQTGVGIVEYMVTGGHKRYGIPPVSAS